MSSIRKFVFLAVLGFVKNSTAVDFSKMMIQIVSFESLCWTFILDYDDDHPNGPGHWNQVNKKCGGLQQSPIDLIYR